MQKKKVNTEVFIYVCAPTAYGFRQCKNKIVTLSLILYMYGGRLCQKSWKK